MGRLILFLLLIAVAVLVWKAFGPSSWQKKEAPPQPAIKGPDDDEQFLWELEKRAFKARRAEEQNREQNREQQKRRKPDTPEEP